MLHHIGRMTCDSHQNFAVIQGTDCVIDCLDFCTLWEGVCTYIFSISDFVCRLEFFGSNKHLDNSPTSSYDEIQGVYPLHSCILYTLEHDHGVYNFFNKVSHQKQFI